MNWFVFVLCWVMGIIATDDQNDRIRDRIRARGKCREIRVRNYDVVVKFTCQEDANLFAEDLKNFVSE